MCVKFTYLTPYCVKRNRMKVSLTAGQYLISNKTACYLELKLLGI